MFPKVRFKTQNTIKYLIIIYALGVLSRYLPFTASLSSMSAYLYCFAVVVWMIAIRERFVTPRIRYLFYSIAVLLLFLHFEQTLKYDIYYDNADISRWLWYSYYIPFTLIPYISFVISLLVDKKENKIEASMIVPGIISFSLVALIMSNDLHQLVFVFKDGDLSNLKDYSHGTVFYIDVIWCYLMMVSSFFLCLYKSFKRIRKRHFLIAVVVIAAHQVLHTVLFINPSDKLRIFGIYPFTLPMISNMAFIIFWEMCIMFGTIPSNIDYEDIFEISGISAKLTDEDKNTISSSRFQDPLPDEIRYSADEDINIGNTKIHSRKIPGGYIYWEEDVSQINEINEQLRETAERLSEENALLMEEARIREESERFNAVNRIYDDIAGRLKTKLKTINDILQDNGDRDENAFKQKLIRACVMGAYVKRYSNMTLVSKTSPGKEKESVISSRELELAIKESLEYLSLGYGTEASVFSSCEDEQIPVRSALDAYEILESFLEALVLKSSTVMITILPEDGYDLMIKAVISIPDRVNREEFTDECADIGLLHEDKVIFGEPDDDEGGETVYITIKEAAHG